MCDLCDGADYDDVYSKMHKLISTHGFTVMRVGRHDSAPGLAYTIGLVDSFDHPELVVAGLPLDEAAGVLSALGSCVAGGDRLDSPGRHGLNGTPIAVVPVHTRQLDSGLMNCWNGYYDWLARFDLDLKALQIVMPTGGYCCEHQKEQPDLSKPAHVPFDGMTRQRRRHCGEIDSLASTGRSRRGRLKRPGRAAPPATIRDVRRHRRNTRRRR